jgi:DNA polymerase-3 subunit epsilon
MTMKKLFLLNGIRHLLLKSAHSIESVDLNTPIEHAKYVVFDTELTGLQPKKDSIVSIGAVKMQGGRINMSDFFYRVVEPRTKLTGASVLIHGITPTEASECPSIEVLFPEFLEYLGDCILVGHFVSVDMAFINLEMKRLYGLSLQKAVVDTYMIYKWMRQKEEDVCAYHGGISEDVSLSAIAAKYDIPVNGAHNSIEDAFVTAQLFQRFISFLPKFGIKTVGDLLKIGRQ